MLKQEARKLFKQKRDAITASEKMKRDDLILIQFQSAGFPFVSNVLSFYSIDERNEVNSFLITAYLHFKNPSLQVAYPKMNIADTTMNAVFSPPDSAFAENEFGITEPEGNEIIAANEIEMVLVPLLAIDKKGHRVGYGKGYYDRFLKECSDDCLKIGLSYFEPLDSLDDVSDFDIPLDFCITPEKIYVF